MWFGKIYPQSFATLWTHFQRTGTLSMGLYYMIALPYGNGYTLPMALMLAGQQMLLPMTMEMRQRHSCLSTIPVKRDLRIESMPQMVNRTSAWRWAIETLLPRASSNRIFSLYHYTSHYASDPQSNATLGNLDLAIQNGAFIVDLDPDAADDLVLLKEIFRTLDPLFDAYGWHHDEHVYTRAVSIAGGVVFCSFASQTFLFGRRCLCRKIEKSLVSCRRATLAKP